MGTIIEKPYPLAHECISLKMRMNCAMRRGLENVFLYKKKIEIIHHLSFLGFVPEPQPSLHVKRPGNVRAFSKPFFIDIPYFSSAVQ